MDRIGTVIRKKRKELGWTQEQLANHLEVTYQAVSKWENDLLIPDIQIMPGIAKIFRMSLDELMGTDDIGQKQRAYFGNIFGGVHRDIHADVGNVFGTVKGDIYGDVKGGIFGKVRNIYGNVEGSVWGKVEGDISGCVKGSLYGRVSGSVKNGVHGKVIGKIIGDGINVGKKTKKKDENNEDCSCAWSHAQRKHLSYRANFFGAAWRGNNGIFSSRGFFRAM